MTPTTRRYGISDEADPPRAHPEDFPDFAQLPPKGCNDNSAWWYLALVIFVCFCEWALISLLLRAK